MSYSVDLKANQAIDLTSLSFDFAQRSPDKEFANHPAPADKPRTGTRYLWHYLGALQTQGSFLFAIARSQGGLGNVLIVFYPVAVIWMI